MMRLPATWDVRVYWECGGRADVSHVRDLSTGGIFIETKWHRTKGDVVRVHFLVQEGPISLDSVVAQMQPSEGLGLKFQTVATKDIPKLGLLLERVRATSLAEAVAIRSEGPFVNPVTARGDKTGD